MWTAKRNPISALISGLMAIGIGTSAAIAGSCPAERPEPMVPTSLEKCLALREKVRDPSAYPLAEYEDHLNNFFMNFCHRDKEAGWARDKHVRDTGPMSARLVDGEWKGTYAGTHAPVVIWYSPEMYSWIQENRGPHDEGFHKDKSPVPDGAMIIKEMYPAPASVCKDVAPERLLPSSGAAIMVRDSKASHDGWFWGWYGFTGYAPDYPANNNSNPIVNMGFAQYCLNCHSSARDHQTFSSLKNIEGEEGLPLVFLNQDEDPTPESASNHPTVVLPGDTVARLGQPLFTYNPAFLDAFTMPKDYIAPTHATAGADGLMMPSETYDETFVPAGGPTIHSEYLTSSQCLGCHDAGSTGLQFDMTVPVTDAERATLPNKTPNLWNHSPYATWRTSPMGLAGRDPIFFAQLSSETSTFHPGIKGIVENTCLGCHGIMGQRQFGIDNYSGSVGLGATKSSSAPDLGSCGTFTREMVDAVPYPADNPHADQANYGALARDGISCLSCHRMVLGEKASAEAAKNPENHCVLERQAFLNKDEKGFAKTFTGSFLVGGPDKVFGPFENPRQEPMKDAFGNIPEHSSTLATSETCGTCHTVHLPVFHKGEQVGTVYEQLTYPEWAFSAYRTGTSPDGPLPEGAGARAESCQGCHMPNKEADGSLTKSRIASIQEYSNFPQAEFTRKPEEIDLPVREGFARHTLVGLNVFLTKMAQQFPDVLGIRTQDPMLVSKGVDPLIFTEQQMLNQAADGTVDLGVTGLIFQDDGTLSATVTVTSKVGHKFPSGVGFRRAFLTFEIMNQLGEVVWASGKTDGAGRIIDAAGAPIDGEMWWAPNCSARIEPEKRLHQPHYQTVTKQSQAQIYQELVSTPPATGVAHCGHGAEPAGQLTTSFLSICSEVKDNRLLPHGYLDVAKRIKIAKALGAKKDMAEDSGATAVGDDPDYADGNGGGRDSVTYLVPRADMKGSGKGRWAPSSVRVQLSYQATPPFYLQDRFCTAQGVDRDRLYFLSGHLNLGGTAAANWALKVADTGAVAIR